MVIGRRRATQLGGLNIFGPQTMAMSDELVRHLSEHPSVTDPVESLSLPGFREKITGLAKFPLGRLSF